MKTILRLAGTRGLTLVGVLSLAGSMTALGAAPLTTVANSAAPAAATKRLASDCPGGAVLENSSARSGIPECKLPGSPEGAAELGVAEQQRASIYTAGTGAAPAGTYAAALAAMQALPNAASAASGWALQGKAPLDASQTFDLVGSPFPQSLASLGLKDLTGRITDLAYDPAPVWNFQRLFASAAEGGVWESRDGGKSWRSIGDHLITQSVGAIAFVPGAPTGGDDGTLVVGTGDNAQGRYNYSGHGIYYSHDDGNSWQAASPNVKDPSQNFRIRVSPLDPHRVYAATSKGLFQGVFSTDFSSLAFRDMNLPVTPAGYPTNCNGVTDTFPCFLASNVTDVEVRSPGALGAAAPEVAVQGDEVIANVGSRFGNRPYDANTAFKQTPQAGIYKSTVCLSVGSCNFHYVTPVGTCTLINSACFPTTDHIGRTSLAAAHGSGQNHDIVYALVQDPVKENACFDDFDVAPVCFPGATDPVLGLPLPGGNLSTVLDGMYYSKDFGNTWLKVMDWGQLDLPGTNSSIGGLTGQAPFGYGPGIQSSYNNWVLIDPTQTGTNGQPTRLLFGLEEIWESNPLYPGTLTGLTPAYDSGWLTQKPTENTGEPPWVVVGRYWSACGPFTFGSGINCNSVSNAGLGGDKSTTHPDQHAAMFVDNGANLNFYAGSDGGMFQQTINGTHPNFDNDSWGRGISGNMNVLQPYDAEISKDGTIVAGLQDNGEMKIDPGSGKMNEIFGGDGLMSGIDPNNSKNIVECYVHAICSWTSDGGLNWTRIDPGVSDPRFDAPLQMDPLDAKHYLTGGRQVMERPWGYQSPPCTNTLDPTCTIFSSTTPDWFQVYDLGTSDHPGDASQPDTSTGPNSDNSASAIDLHGANAYVGFCGLCDVELEGIPFSNGIATNVGGSAPPKATTTDGWHIAKANGLPKRFITSVRMDPNNVNTIYVTLGGYQRVWVPPGAFGETVDSRGGHVFKSTDHGENFTDVSGNLPNTPALWSVIHNGQLVVATDIGVFQSSNTGGGSYSVLGTLPATPVDTLRISPGNPDLMIAALWGRGVWAYCFSGAVCPSNIFVNQGPLPNTSGATRGIAVGLWLAGLVALAAAGWGSWRIQRRRRAV